MLLGERRQPAVPVGSLGGCERTVASAHSGTGKAPPSGHCVGSPGGSARFLQRAWRLAGDVTSEPVVSFDEGDVALRRGTHKTGAEAEHRLALGGASFRQAAGAVRPR
jgi:hypothetical protein